MYKPLCIRTHKHRCTQGTFPLQSQPLCTSPMSTTPLPQAQAHTPAPLPPTPTSLLSIRVVCFKPQLHPHHSSPSMVKFKAPPETQRDFWFFVCSRLWVRSIVPEDYKCSRHGHLHACAPHSHIHQPPLDLDTVL